MATHSNSEPESRSPVLTALLWPPERAGEALYAAAREARLPLTQSEVLTVPESFTADAVSQWIEAAAVRGGFEATPVAIAIDDIRGLAARAAPLLLRVGTQGGFLAIVRGGRRACTVIDPHLTMRRLSLQTLTEALRAPFEARLAPAIDAVTDRLAITPRARVRARAALLNERLKDARLRGCWLLRLPPAAALGTEIRETQLPRRVAALVGSHFVQYALFLLSWWLLGRGVLRGTIDAGWLLGWILLLFSLIPFRLFATVMQGVLATTTGAALRRRLLRGALQVDREEVRRSGAGHLFGHVMETSAVESLALTGGVGALFAVLELAVAAFILIAGATAVTAGVLIAWTLGTLWLTARYFRTRRVWTRDRLSITHRLLESMLGHRTRLAQQPVELWHPDEDASLAQYLAASRHMDRSAVWLNAFIPRGWLAVALGTLILPALRHASPTELAISVGGILLAHRSLRRFVAGLSQITGAAVAGEAILPLIRASLRRDRSSPPHPSAVIGHDTADDPVAIQARDINFRYPQQTDHVLQNCTLTVPRGSRLLLEGASGAGKTTLASLLAGLTAPDSGLVLVNGLDKSVLGSSGWRKRVVMAPQAHDNYLIGASLAFNLLMGVQWPPQKSDLLEADVVCRELGLGDLLDRLPGGLHQIVGETGWQLSQGERTRVFLARALLQKPDVLVLDESFSALDPENVDRAIRCVMRRATTVVAIAHP